ncbi:MAG: patatin-like phospholipase family protein [Gammaproteobacteria bacterium]
MQDRYYQMSEVLAEEYGALRPKRVIVLPAATDDECARVAAIQQQMLHDDTGLTALCLSGGGIRSATFALGVVQGLAKMGILERFDYLSTVSGGGYLGAWLSAWIQRHPQGVVGVSAALAGAPQGSQADTQAKDPEQVRHLRDYSNYLAPRLGTFSIDTWTLVATYLRNLLLNWLVSIPLLCLLLLLPRIYAMLLLRTPPPGVLYGLLGVVMVLITSGLIYVGMDRPTAGSRNRDQAHFVRGCLLPLGIAVLLISLGWAWLHSAPEADLRRMGDWRFMVVSATLVYFFAWCVHLWPIRKTLRAQAGEKFAEGVAALISGAAAGAMVWFWTQVFNAVVQTPDAIAFYTCCAAPALWFTFTLAETLFIGLASRVTGEEDREWWARSGAWILLALSTWLVLSVIVIYGPELVLWLWQQMANYLTAIGGVTGALTFWSARNAMNMRPSAASNTPLSGADNLSWNARLTHLALKITAPLTVLMVLVFLVFLTDWIFTQDWPSAVGDHLAVIHDTPPESLLIFAAVALLIGGVMARFINVNRFSLHAMYRNRLIRAYLGASRPSCPADKNIPPDPNCRHPHPFTGFDAADNLSMHQLWSNQPLTAECPRPPPLHVINIALNLVHGKRLAWQQRKAASFTVTPLHAGGCCVGYRKVDQYGGERGISLGTAMTISGAAACPNMGYQSKPSLGFLMSIFNARLGWWLGNPANADTWTKKGPDYSVTPLIDEMLGLTSEDNPWVYLSDGGHFDNLGVYEMVQRRCRLIVVSDAGADPHAGFEDLGNALRKIRTDLGVDIELQGETIGMHARDDAGPGHYCALFRICYGAAWGDTAPEAYYGRLLYIKPGLCGHEPMDIFNYASDHPDFPHESTRDQFFAESQFESYRNLGEYSVEYIAAHWHTRVESLEDLFAAAEVHCGGPGAPAPTGPA